MVNGAVMMRRGTAPTSRQAVFADVGGSDQKEGPQRRQSSGGHFRGEHAPIDSLGPEQGGNPAGTFNPTRMCLASGRETAIA